MTYKKTTLNKAIDITQIVTIHYFEYAKDFYFKGEKHDFWEFLYVDKGKVIVYADEKKHDLHAGQMIFHKPNEFHNVIADGIVSPNLVVMSFDCKSPAMIHFEDKIINIDNHSKNVLVKILNEYKDTFCHKFNDFTLKSLHRKEQTIFGGEQLINNYLEELLILLLRGTLVNTKVKSSIQEQNTSIRLKEIHHFMLENLSSNLTVTTIASEMGLSVSSIQKIFKMELHLTPLQYFRKLKFDEAKYLIRNGNLNFTQIALKLGFNSLHYFSRSFKKNTNMSLSEYASSVKVKINY